MSSAPENARSEAAEWMFIANIADLLQEYAVPEATEVAVTGFDPGSDLDKRTSGWFHRLPDRSLASLARFAAGLAQAEAEAWERDDPSVATRALSDRRFLAGDRMIHWAVPWTVSFGSLDLESGPEAVAVVERLLTLGDQHRVAPALTGTEGLYPLDNDSIGPLQETLDTTTALCGWFFGAGVVEASAFDAAEALWTDLADRHPGSARLWLDYATRAHVSRARV
jgi:hypothetical protein